MAESKKTQITSEDLKRAVSEEIKEFLRKHQERIIRAAHKRLRRVQDSGT